MTENLTAPPDGLPVRASWRRSQSRAAVGTAAALRARPRRRLIAAFAVAPLAIAVAACGVAGGTQARTDAAARPSTAAHSAPAYSPPPTAKATGKYVGSCDYTLNDNFGSSVAAWATGDIEVRNTGNVGIVVRLRITWPQQGFPSLARHKTVKLAYGSRRDIQFHLPLNQNQISNLQNWQEGHNYASGCTYKATIVSNFGTPR
jgi:hypothetical protein